MCARCYRQWLVRTPPDQRPPAPRFARQFWDLVRKDGPVPQHDSALGQCWTWHGPHDRKGYGRWRKEQAHRHSWKLAHGPIGDGLWVLHHCDNPPCVNPGHLYLGTVAENVRDAVQRNRVHHPPCKERCTAGHALEGDNLRIVSSGSRTIRRCRQCDNERSASHQREVRRARGLRKTRLSDHERAKILELRHGGMSHRKIAAAVGRSLMAVQAVLKEAGALWRSRISSPPG